MITLEQTYDLDKQKEITLKSRPHANDIDSMRKKNEDFKEHARRIV